MSRQQSENPDEIEELKRGGTTTVGKSRESGQRVPFSVSDPNEESEVANAKGSTWIAIKNFGPDSIEASLVLDDRALAAPAPREPILIHPGSEIEVFKASGAYLILRLNPEYGSNSLAVGWTQRRPKLQTA
jgi:hypothetical protein